MRQIIYNDQTKQLSKFYENGYNVPIPAHEQSYIFVLDVIEPEQPSHDPITQKITSKWVKDLEAREYRKEWTVENKTPYELAMQDWHEPDYSKRIEADVELLDPVNPNLTQEVSDLIHRLYNYLRAQGLPEHGENGTKYIYINVVQPQHQAFADSLNGLTITPRPEPEDYE